MKINQSTAHFKATDQMSIAIVMSKYNDSLGNELLENTIATLKKHQVKENNIEVYYVPGALEIAFVTKKLIAHPAKYDAIITLGIVIKGDTYHFELVCNESYRGLTKLNLESSLPIIYGILTVNTIEQAQNRVSASGLNKGEEFALAALEMVTINKSL